MLGRAVPTLVIAAILAASPAAAQQEIRRPGLIRHEAADANFPERIGEFRRTRVVQYDSAGMNMSAGYDLERPEGRLTLTVYVYPASRIEAATGRADACRQEFEATSAAITRQYPNVRRTRTGAPPVVAGSRPELSHRAAFTFRMTFDERTQDLQSELDLYCDIAERWTVKVRATSPATFPAAQAIETFIRTGPWPGRRPPDFVAGVGESGAADAAR